MPRIASFAAVLLLSVAALAAPGERPRLGDVTHGEAVFRKGKGGKLKIDGSWTNAYTDGQLRKALQKGKGGLPRISTDNPLEVWDALAYLRSRNTDLRDFAGDASHVLVAKGTLDQYAKERLTEAKVELTDDDDTRRVFALYTLGERDAFGDLAIVWPKQSRKRDELKPEVKAGYAVFGALRGFEEGDREVAFVVDKDVVIQAVQIRKPDGTPDEELNRIAKRLVGKGLRGGYKELRLGGGGRKGRALQKPLSDAYLRFMESVYMFEVKERDYFLF